MRELVAAELCELRPFFEKSDGFVEAEVAVIEPFYDDLEPRKRLLECRRLSAGRLIL